MNEQLRPGHEWAALDGAVFQQPITERERTRRPSPAELNRLEAQLRVQMFETQKELDLRGKSTNPGGGGVLY